MDFIRMGEAGFTDKTTLYSTNMDTYASPKVP